MRTEKELSTFLDSPATKYAHEYVYPGGDKKTQPRVAIAIVNNNILYVIKRGALCKNAGKYGLITGRVDVGETHLQAAVREFEEETTVKLRPEVLRFSFAGDHKGAMVTYYEVDVSSFSTLRLQHTAEVEAYAELHELPAEAELHYSTQQFLETWDACGRLFKRRD